MALMCLLIDGTKFSQCLEVFICAFSFSPTDTNIFLYSVFPLICSSPSLLLSYSTATTHFPLSLLLSLLLRPFSPIPLFLSLLVSLVSLSGVSDTDC